MELAEVVTRTLCRGAAERGEGTIPLEEALALVMEYLPNLVGALDDQLILDSELASAITDRFVVWLAHRRGRRFRGSDPSWELVVDGVTQIVRAQRKDPSSGS